MRVTILFFLVAIILVLIIWAWNLLPSGSEAPPLTDSRKLEQIEKIRNYTDLEALKGHAIDMVNNRDEKAIERDRVTGRVMILLALTLGIAVIGEIILFFEIAARGRAAGGKSYKSETD